MSCLEFPGLSKLSQQLDKAVQYDDPNEITQNVKNVLESLIKNKEIQVPKECMDILPSGYGRRLLHHSEEYGYTAIAMTWGSGQGTPIHDHCDMWCVEAVWTGEIQVIQYDLIDKKEDLYQFERKDEIIGTIGCAGCLIPPYDYHVIRNTCGESTAVSLHVYSGDMKACNVFTPTQNDSWYKKESKALCYNN